MGIRAVSDSFRQSDIPDAARAALNLRQGIAKPDLYQRYEVPRAEVVPAAQSTTLSPLLTAAQSSRAWIDSGKQRAPIKTTFIRFWRLRQLLRDPIPLTAAAALWAEQFWASEDGCGAGSAGNALGSKIIWC